MKNQIEGMTTKLFKDSEIVALLDLIYDEIDRVGGFENLPTALKFAWATLDSAPMAD